MKPHFLIFTVFLYSVCVCCEATRISRQDIHVLPSSLDSSMETTVETPESTEDPIIESGSETDSDQDVTDRSEETVTTEGSDNETTTEHTNIETTSATPDRGSRDCPNGESSYSEHDLTMILKFFADGELNIMANISDAYYDTVIKAKDALEKEFNDYKMEFANRPQHLMHVLDEMVETREQKINPLVKTAAATLQEFSAVEDEFNKFIEKTMKIMDDFNKYKRICELSNCSPQLMRSSFTPKTKLIFVSKNRDKNMCSSIEKVHATIRDKLLSFEREEIERLKEYITNNKNLLKEVISSLKLRLREAAVSHFGITMYEIISLSDDQYHLIQSLIDFNEKKHVSLLKKKLMRIEYKLLDLDANIQKFKQHCLSCGQIQRRRRFVAYEMEEGSTDAVLNKNEITLLDQVINDKIVVIKRVVQDSIENIFKNLNDTVNDNELVEKTIATLQPIQDDISNRTQVEKGILETLMKSVSKESFEHVQNVQLNATELLSTISTALDYFKRNPI